MKTAMKLESARAAGWSRGRLGKLPKERGWGDAGQRAYRTAYANGRHARVNLIKAGLLKGAA